MLTNEQKFDRIKSSLANYYTQIQSKTEAAKGGNPQDLADCYKALHDMQQYLTGLLDGMSNHRKD